MTSTETFKAYCNATKKEIIYGIQTIQGSRNRIAKIKTCSNSDHCTKSDCWCNDGDQNYIKIIKEIKGEII